MDFTRLNLRPYRLNEGVATGNNAIEGEAKASASAIDVSNPRQMDPRRKEMQMKQRTAKFGSPTTQQNVMSSFDILQQQKQAVKMFENQKADWRKELLEAANPDDDPNHPFVEIMPSTEFKPREAEQNVKKGVVKDKMAGAAPGRSGLGEELILEKKKAEEYEFTEAAPAIAAVAGKAAGALAGKGVAKATAGAAAKGGIRKFAARKATEYATDKATDTVTSLLSPNDQEYNESLTFDDVWNMIEARAAYADPAPVKHKKDTGKAISKGKYKGAVKNKDNTASPKENVARRTFNRNPQMKGDLQDKVKQSVLVDD